MIGFKPAVHLALSSQIIASRSVKASQRVSTWIDYGICLASFALASGLTYRFAANPSASLFFCLAAVTVTVGYCSRIPRLLIAAATILFIALQLPPAGNLAIDSPYRPLFAVYVGITVLLCGNIPVKFRERRASRYTQALVPPVLTPEETLDGAVKEQALAHGDITLPKEAIYQWMREFAHLRDLIWNIDDSWRRRDWRQLASSIKMAYRQAAQAEQALLKAGAEILDDPQECGQSRAHSRSSEERAEEIGERIPSGQRASV